MFLFSCFLLVAASGCFKTKTHDHVVTQASHEYYQAKAGQIEYPELQHPVPSEAIATPPPLDLNVDLEQLCYQDVSLVDAVTMALKNSKTMRNLGTTVLRSPEAATTVFDSAIRETDPRLGVHAALSAFDTSFAASVLHQNNDRALNNQFFGGGTRLLQQEATVMQAQLSKQTASGTEYILRNITDYDKNNAPGNRFPGAWTTQLEAEFRQPLMQGYGVDYWHTVGESQTPGVYSGVLIARTNTDINQAEFELSVRDFIAEVENAYWDLYFAYRDLDAKVAARDAALDLWRRIDTLKQLGRAGGEADKEAQAREQFYRFEEDVQNALNGRVQDNTRTFNGAGAGTFRGSGGVLRLERRLRYLIGTSVNECCLMRPSDEPLAAPVCFDWFANLAESIDQRPELRRQQWVIKQKELELIAAKKLLLPKLDAMGTYRWRGFGETLTNPSNGGAPRFDSAFGDLASGRFQEWELGLEFEVPLGNRQAHAGIRNAEFQLARARQLLKEQERVIVHELSNATTETTRAWKVLQTVSNRLKAAADQVDSIKASYEADQAPVNLVLEAQRRYSTAKSDYYTALLEYNNAVRNVHYEKGTYLEYCGVHVSEGQWGDQAHAFAERVASRREVAEPPAWVKQPRIISHGTTADPYSHEVEAAPETIISEPMMPPVMMEPPTEPEQIFLPEMAPMPDPVLPPAPVTEVKAEQMSSPVFYPPEPAIPLQPSVAPPTIGQRPQVQQQVYEEQIDDLFPETKQWQPLKLEAGPINY